MNSPIIDPHERHTLSEEASRLTANEIREMRNDMYSRYREDQLREGWKNQSNTTNTSHVTQEMRNVYEQIGGEVERSEKREQDTKRFLTLYHEYKNKEECEDNTLWNLFALIGVIWVGYVFVSFIKNRL